MVGELGDQHLALIQLFRMVKPGILATGQADDRYPLFLGLDDEIIAAARPLFGSAGFGLLLLIHERHSSPTNISTLLMLKEKAVNKNAHGLFQHGKYVEIFI
ncbi:hypothetical protein D1872_314570 [compost metagenome]